MASATAEEVEDYESDPEEAKRSLTMRRREASDDEEDESEGESGLPPRRIESRGSRAGIESDGGESDGGGAPAEYDDEEEAEAEAEAEAEEEEIEEEEELEEYEVVVEEEEEEYERSGGKEGGGGVEEREVEGEERGRDVGETTEEVNNQGDGEEKKENEPFAVPTAGAFYMHDDRFRDNAGGRNRRTLGGGRKLWESRDDKKWGHDKFEEMTLRDRPYEQGMRNSRGRYRAHGKNRVADRGYPAGNKSKVYNNNNNNQNNGPKAVRGRGPRRYEPSKMNNIEAPPTQHRRGYGKSTEKVSHPASGRTPAPTPNTESDSVPSRKQVVASSLSSASPPFYPSASSSKDLTSTQTREVQAGTISQSNTMIRGKNVVNSGGMEKAYVNNSISPNAVKPSTSLQLPPSGSSLVNTTQAFHPRAHRGGVALSGQGTFQKGAPHNLVSRASPPAQPHNIQRSPAQTRVQPSVQQLGHRLGSGSQTSSPPKAGSSMNSYGPVELESPPESSKSKTALVGKGSVQVSGRSSFLYGGAQLMGAPGNMGSGRGDQNFTAAPAFLPVMPFGGQHPGGMGVPAVGMAFPGYVAQPQLGMGNSEMAWLPVLAGAAGALGATYCSPYLSVDGAYQSRQSGQTSSSGASSKEDDINKPNSDWKPSQRPELASDEFGQRQKNTRRYTEMNFGQ